MSDDLLADDDLDDDDLDADEDEEGDDGGSSDVDADVLGETKRHRVFRTGDRDISFTGKLIGIGTSGSLNDHYESRIYATEAGKFIAARRRVYFQERVTHKAQVCESAATVAAFYHIIPSTPEPKRGQKVTPPVPFFCSDGKRAVEQAASYFEDFESLYIEEVE